MPRPRKINDRQMEDIKLALRNGERQCDIARRYGVQQAYISKINRKRVMEGWGAHLPTVKHQRVTLTIEFDSHFAKSAVQSILSACKLAGVNVTKWSVTERAYHRIDLEIEATDKPTNR